MVSRRLRRQSRQASNPSYKLYRAILIEFSRCIRSLCYTFRSGTVVRCFSRGHLQQRREIRQCTELHMIKACFVAANVGRKCGIPVGMFLLNFQF